jgi:hypothetical protein
MALASLIQIAAGFSIESPYTVLGLTVSLIVLAILVTVPLFFLKIILKEESLEEKEYEALREGLL